MRLESGPGGPAAFQSPSAFACRGGLPPAKALPTRKALPTAAPTPGSHSGAVILNKKAAGHDG